MENLEEMSNYKNCKFAIKIYLIHKNWWRCTNGTLTDTKMDEHKSQDLPYSEI
jgi:hypothetical protein